MGEGVGSDVCDGDLRGGVCGEEEGGGVWRGESEGGCGEGAALFEVIGGCVADYGSPPPIQRAYPDGGSGRILVGDAVSITRVRGLPVEEEGSVEDGYRSSQSIFEGESEDAALRQKAMMSSSQTQLYLSAYVS